MFDRTKKGERALLVLPLGKNFDDEACIQEFTELARSAGAQVLAIVTARIDKPNPKFYVGTGKADEIAELKQQYDADLILVNHALSPIQERNLEKHAQCRVVDRTGLILDIFAQRARSHEGKLQVELAQLRHLATRLVRGWTHLERQRGYIGMRGPGETQLESDRRLLAERVKILSTRLKKIEVQREQGRRARLRGGVPVIALVGYTNAGKSTLFNALTGANAYAADQLFATLDPTVRKLTGLDSGAAVLADTVGFIRDLPHDLVAAFRSTLAEARDADLLLHIIDAADSERAEYIKQVERVLEEIGVGDVPRIEVFNKIDQLEMEPRLDCGVEEKPLRVWLSAVQGQGFDLLRQAIDSHFARERVHTWLHLPMDSGRLRAKLFEIGAVASEQIENDGWHMEIDAPWQSVEPLFGLSDGDGAWLKSKIGLPQSDVEG